MIKRNPYTHNL